MFFMPNLLPLSFIAPTLHPSQERLINYFLKEIEGAWGWGIMAREEDG
jgi:hypothetical protein